jgi:hypothetical protein
VAVLQVVAVPFPPFLTTPGHPGGGGVGEIQTANQYRSQETQPLARRVGWGLRRVGWGLNWYMFSQSSIVFFFFSPRPHAEFGLADEAVKGTVAPPGRE